MFHKYKHLFILFSSIFLYSLKYNLNDNIIYNHLFNTLLIHFKFYKFNNDSYYHY